MMVLLNFAQFSFFEVSTCLVKFSAEHQHDDKVWCSLVVSSVPSLLAFLAAEQESLVTKVSADFR